MKQERCSLISVFRSSLSSSPVEYHLLDTKEQRGLGEARDAPASAVVKDSGGD